jgi:hypothetical protein
VLASVITLVALPTIWLANRSDGGTSTRPNVAAVGIDPGQADAETGAAGGAVFDPMGTSGAAHLEPLSTAVPQESVVIAVGTTPDDPVATAHGSYRRSIYVGTCRFNGLPGGSEVTVVNVANGRSTTCTTERSTALEDGELLLSQSGFQRIAELTAAPIHVEIRQ